jgi:hypothetical protein
MSDHNGRGQDSPQSVGEETARRIPYEKPQLIRLNLESAAMGTCNNGSTPDSGGTANCILGTNLVGS